MQECQPECVAIENLFFAVNVRSALKLGHARGVAMLAAVEAGLPVFEYAPAEIKLAVVGHGRAEKAQVQQMVKLILGLAAVPSPQRRGRCAGGGHLPRARARAAARGGRDARPEDARHELAPIPTAALNPHR